MSRDESASCGCRRVHWSGGIMQVVYCPEHMEPGSCHGPWSLTVVDLSGDEHVEDWADDAVDEVQHDRDQEALAADLEAHEDPEAYL